MDIKTFYQPRPDWTDLKSCESGWNTELGYTEYMFSSENHTRGVLTYYQGGELDGQLCVEPSDLPDLERIPNWKFELKKHFTEQTGLPVKEVEVW